MPETVSVGPRFQIRGVLGSGGMGEVFLADDLEGGGEVALKRLTRHESEADVLRFKQEFRTMARLHHPNLCEARSFGTAPDGTPFYAMEVVPGVGLDERRPMPADHLLPLIAQMAAGLGYVHAQGLVHADVKPENFRLRPDGVLKLMDFGLLIPAGQRHEGIAGTIAYMAPEAAKNERLDQRSDLYSLGVVIYELLTGQLPIRGATPLEILRGHLSVTPISPAALVPNVPDALSRAIMRLLAKEPAARFASAAELVHALGLTAEVDDSVRLLEPPFVGRRALLADAEAALRDLGEHGRGDVREVVGEAGLGKSRLLEEIRVLAQLAGRPAVVAAAEPAGGPLSALAAAVRGIVPLAREHAPDVLAAEGPTLAVLAPELGAATAAAEGEDDATKIQAAAGRLLAATLAAGRGALLLDGWDQADAGSRAALEYLLRNAAAFGGAAGGAMPFLVVVTGRTALGVGTEVALAGVDAAEGGALVAGMLGQAEVPGTLADQIHGLTLGRPRAIVDLVRHAAHVGAIARAGGAWQVPATLPADALTADAKQIAVERLAKLFPPIRDVARGATLLAEPFDLGQLIAVAGREEAAIDAADALTGAGVFDVLNGAYRFASAELKAALADELAGTDVGVIHGAVAKALQARWPDGPPNAGAAADLARHLLAGGPADEAVRAALVAARRAIALGSSDATDRLLEQAQARLGELPATPEWNAARIDLLYHRSHLAGHRYDLKGSLELDREGLAAAEAIGDKARMARVLSGMAIRLGMSGVPAAEVEAAGARAVALAREAGDLPLLARAGTNHGRWLVLQGRAAEGRVVLEEAYRVAREGGHRFFEARALASLGFARCAEVADRPAGIAQLEEAIKLQAENRDRYGEGFSRNLLYDALMRACRYEEAVEVAAGGAAIMRELDAVDDTIYQSANEAQAALELGDTRRARAAAKAAYELGTSKRHPIAATYVASLYGRACGLLGEPEALKLLQGADEAARATASAFIIQNTLPHIVEGMLALGAVASAAAALQEGVFTLRSVEAAGVKAMVAALLAEVRAAEGKWADAAAQAADAINLAGQAGADGWLSRACAVAAIAAAAQEDREEAYRLADRAQAVAARCAQKPVLAVLAGLRGEQELGLDPHAAQTHFQAMQVLADGIGSPLLRARALFGQGLAMPAASHAQGLVDQAQRLVQDQAAALPDADHRALLASSIGREVLARNPVVTPVGAAAGSAFGEQFQRVSQDLQQLFVQYGAMRRDWEENVARLRRLNELASRMGAVARLDEVLPQVVALTLEITNAERGFVVLKSNDRYGNLTCEAAYDREGRALGPSDWSLSLCQKVIAANEAITILDASNDADFQAAKSIVAFNVRTVMGVPLVAKGGLLGVLYVDSSAVVTTFTEADLEILRGLALHAGVAIENARLYERLDRRNAELEEALAKFRTADAAASTDQLTGLANRRKFLEESEREIQLARRFGHPLGVLILDVDHFKKFNDTYGHAIGDDVLKAVGSVLPQQVAPGELPARLGGEEFVVLVPTGGATHALALGERIRQAISELVIHDYEGNPVRQITASIGVAVLHGEDRAIGDALERADAALYACKRDGRNQVQLWKEGMATQV